MRLNIKISLSTIAATAVLILTVKGCAHEGVLRVSNNDQDRNDLIWVEATALINAPPEVVWKLVAEDFDENSLYTYNVEESFYLHKKPEMIGTIRGAVETSGDSFDVEIIAYNEKDAFIEWEIIRVDSPITTGVASYTVSEINGTTKITFRGGFRMKYFFMDWMAKRKFPDGFKAILAGIKLRAEKGVKLKEGNIEDIMNEYGDQVQAKIVPYSLLQ